MAAYGQSPVVGQRVGENSGAVGDIKLLIGVVYCILAFPIVVLPFRVPPLGNQRGVVCVVQKNEEQKKEKKQ